MKLNNQSYRALLIKHYKNPLNKGLIKDSKKHQPNYVVLKNNNINCGDKIKIQIYFYQKIITNIRYEAEGCSIFIASASLMSVYLKNLNFKLGICKIENFINMIQNKPFQEDILDKDLLCLKPISFFPGKFICISAPWLLLLKNLEK
ncbi:iron-sulfur cluster assembly scaffold protein [Candidatus Phytoplasma melaleucae]|uniref:Iron-sulfur cluster assembly scaffold protein n=1 Tax=Candidatus Phytoplasma melaleucae TaxID=2982630 RepID=A0ABT9DDR3_9MOLU|nr:iron-sulfur cluster assembly scaffold protein ['Melaleuca sp.' phytoplasma]MDO8168164.1 iron-sulfur cluster assembly scaffold protein ['Melaleuca sp.' phytoplasma]